MALGNKTQITQKGFAGAMAVFLVPKCCQKFASDAATATKSVKKQNST